MSSTDEPGSDSEQRAASAGVQPAAKPSRGPFCQVCGSGLSGRYETRFKVCRTHREADEVQHNGKVQRFCQQCNTFHVTERFEGGQRSCREQLARHAERRRELRRARREAEQGRSSPSSDGQHAASRRQAAVSPQRFNSAPAPLPLSLVLPGQPSAAALPGSTQPDGSPAYKRQRAHSDALALLASMSVDALHAPMPPAPQQPQAQLQQSDTQSETLKLPALLQQPQPQPAGAQRQGSPGAPAQQALTLPPPPLLQSKLASTESAATSAGAAMGPAAVWDASHLPLHPLTRAASLPGPPMPSRGGQPANRADLAALGDVLAAAASRRPHTGAAPSGTQMQGLLPATAAQQQQPDLGLMLHQLLGQHSGSMPPPQQAMMLGASPARDGIGGLSSQVDTALLHLRQQAAQQLLLLEKKQHVLRHTMDALQQVMQPPAALPLAAQPSGSMDALQLLALLHQPQAQQGMQPPLPPPLAAQPSGSMDALQLLALLHQPQPQPQPSVAQQQGSALLQMLGLGQPPQ